MPEQKRTRAIRSRIGITLDAEERQLAERFAEARGLSISSYLGQLLREEERRRRADAPAVDVYPKHKHAV